MFKVIDLETTGLSDSCEIAQLSYWDMDEMLQFTGYGNTYYNIHGEMPPEAYKTNHFTKLFLENKSGGVYFDDVKDKVLESFGDSILVAHNAQYEKKVLTYRLGSVIMQKDWICTMLRYTPTTKLKDRRGNGGFRYCSLSNLYSFLLRESGKDSKYYEDMYTDMTGEIPSFHNALFDSFCTGLALQVLG